MDQANAFITAISMGLGAAWASGINLYAAILTMGLMSLGGYIQLPESLQLVENPLVLTVAGIMFVIEFFADKVPGLDSLWDSIHTFIRIPAGAALAAGAVGDAHPAVMVAALLVGGSVATATHVAKAGTRVAVNTSPEPVTNWCASISEDLLVIAGVWTALKHPWIFLVLFILFILFLIWFLPKLWRFIKKAFAALGRFLGIVKKEDTGDEEKKIESEENK